MLLRVVFLLLGLSLSWPVMAARAKAPVSPTARKTRITLLSRGRRPRRRLRYRWPLRAKALKLINDIRTSTQVTMGTLTSPKIRFPVIRTEIKLRLKRLRKAQRLRMDGTITKLQLLGTPLYPSAMVKKIQKQIKPLRGVRLWSEFSRQGALLRGDVKASARSKQRARGFYENFELSMHQWTAILPSKPIGIGARWRILIPFRRPFRGMQQIDCQLVKRRGNHLTILTRLTRTAPAQALPSPPGQKVSVRLASFKVKGSGTATFDLRGVVHVGRMSIVRRLHLVMTKKGVPPRPFRMKAEVLSTLRTLR